MNNKSMLKGSFFLGAFSGICTLFLVACIFAISVARNLLEAFYLLLGNIILYGLIGLLGGAVGGSFLGLVGARLGKLIKKEQGEKIGGLLGGVIGGIIAGITPVWMGFGHL